VRANLRDCPLACEGECARAQSCARACMRARACAHARALVCTCVCAPSYACA
jgi:hypothetical protein